MCVLALILLGHSRPSWAQRLSTILDTRAGDERERTPECARERAAGDGGRMSSSFKSREEYEAWKSSKGGGTLPAQRDGPASEPKPGGSLAPCPDCGREISRRAPVCPHCGAPIGPTLSEPAGRDFAGLPAYYREEFARIRDSREQYKGKWNWAAFLLGPLWGLLRGVWLPSLIGIVGAVFTFGIVGVVYWFVFGLRGNYFYYSAHVKGKQRPI